MPARPPVPSDRLTRLARRAGFTSWEAAVQGLNERELASLPAHRLAHALRVPVKFVVRARAAAHRLPVPPAEAAPRDENTNPGRVAAAPAPPEPEPELEPDASVDAYAHWVSEIHETAGLLVEDAAALLRVSPEAVRAWRSRLLAPGTAAALS